MAARLDSIRSVAVDDSFLVFILFCYHYVLDHVCDVQVHCYYLIGVCCRIRACKWDNIFFLFKCSRGAWIISHIIELGLVWNLQWSQWAVFYGVCWCLIIIFFDYKSLCLRYCFRSVFVISRSRCKHIYYIYQALCSTSIFHFSMKKLVNNGNWELGSQILKNNDDFNTNKNVILNLIF